MDIRDRLEYMEGLLETERNRSALLAAELQSASRKVKRLQQQVRGLGYAPLFEEE